MVTYIEKLCKKVAEHAVLLSGAGRVVKTWDELVDVTDEGLTAVVNSEIEVTSSETITTGVIEFVGGGALQTAGIKIVLNCPVLNPLHAEVFKGYVLDESYTAKWSATGSNITGTFGGNPNRYPAWWGLKGYNTNGEALVAPLSVAQKNNNAIAAAMLSQINHFTQVYVVMPHGVFPIHRTIRLDGIKATLQGPNPAAYNSTTFYCLGEDWFFDTSYYILTDDYPDTGNPDTDGTTPAIQIGNQIQAGNNLEEGFLSGVRGITVRGPVYPYLPPRRFSCIMWEHQLQEGSRVENVGLFNYGGYALGGPRLQRLTHNGPPQGYYLQLNTVSFHGIWTFTPTYHDAVCICIAGLNYSIDMVTVGHGIGYGGVPPFTGMTAPAIIAASRTCGRWSNFHIETRIPVDGEAIGILVPDEGVIQRLDISDINVLTQYLGGTVSKSTTLKVVTSRGGVTARAIHNMAAYNYQGGARAIRDTYTGRESKGHHSTPDNSDFVALYARQLTELFPQVVSTDKYLDLSAEVTYDPPLLNDGDVHIAGPFTLHWSVINSVIDASFSLDLQGIELSAWCETSENVKVMFRNNTGAPIDLGEGTLRLLARKI